VSGNTRLEERESIVSDDVPITEAAKPCDDRGLKESSDGDMRCYFLVEVVLPCDVIRPRML
jgi:hypothetical protein